MKLDLTYTEEARFFDSVTLDDVLKRIGNKNSPIENVKLVGHGMNRYVEWDNIGDDCISRHSSIFLENLYKGTSHD